MNVQEAVRSVRSNPEAMQKGQEQFQQMLARSATDREFRQQLLTNPRAAVAEYTGREIPSDWNLKFIENQGTATIVLPDYVGAGAELSERDLEQVAGGVVPLMVVLTVEIFVAVTAGIASD